jgi:tRNA threonylcarbamoyl adenosine modification protein YeaZ
MLAACHGIDYSIRMLTLAIDTVTGFCSACLYKADTGRVLASEEREIGRGHAEELIATVERVLGAASSTFTDVQGIAVTVGPGSFTGIRVGVAAARGFGLALGIPVRGVTTFEAIAADAAGEAGSRPLTVAITGGRGQVFMQSFDGAGIAIVDAQVFAEGDAASGVPGESALLAGNAATLVATQLGRHVPVVCDVPTGSIATVARLGAVSAREPIPLYMRDADAKPQAGFTLERRACTNSEAAQ